MNTGKYGRSFAALKELLALDPLNTEARRLFATLHLRIGSLMTARSAFESLANEALQRQDYWLAESLLKEYLVAGPRCVPFLEMLAHVYEEKGDPIAAVVEYGKAIEILVEDSDPDHPNRPTELYAKIRELAPASPAALRLATLFDAATGKVLRPPTSHAPTENLSSAPTPEAGATFPGETSDPSLPGEQVTDSAITVAPPLALGEIQGQVPTLPSLESQGLQTVDHSVVARSESQAEVLEGGRDLSQQSSQPVSGVPSQPILNSPVVGEERSGEAIQLAGTDENAVAPLEGRAAVVCSEEPPPGSSSGLLSQVEPPATEPQAEPELRVVSDSDAARTHISAPMPWEQVEETPVQIPQAEPQPIATEAGESANPVPSDNFPAEAASPLPAPSEPTGNPASDLPIGQSDGSTEPVTPTAPPPSAHEELPAAAPTESRLSSLMWDEILGYLGLSSWKSSPPATPQVGPSQHGESSPAPSQGTDKKAENQTHELSVASDLPTPVADESPSPIIATPSLDHEIAKAEGAEGSALSTPMPWEQVEEASVSIPQPEPAPIEVQTEGQEETSISSSTGQEALSLAEVPSFQVQAAEPPVIDLQQPPGHPGPAEQMVEARPVQVGSEFRLAVADTQAVETRVQGETVPIAMESATSMEVGVLQDPIAFQQEAITSPVEAPPPFSVSQEPPAEVQETVLPPVPAVAQDDVPPPSAAAHDESRYWSSPAVLTETENTAKLPVFEESVLPEVDAPDISQPLEHERVTPEKFTVPPFVPSALPPPAASREEITSPVKEEAETLKLHPPHVVPIHEDVSIEDLPWLRTPPPTPVAEPVVPAPPPIFAADATPELAEASRAPSVITRTSAVDVLFERTGRQTPAAMYDTGATDKPRKRRVWPFARVRVGVVLFVRGCAGTTRALVVTLLSLAGLAVAAAVVSVGVMGLLWVAMEQRPNNSFHNLTTSPQRNLTDPKKNGYLMLLGIDAAPTRDPLQVGYERKFEGADRDAMQSCLAGSDGQAMNGSASEQVVNGWFHTGDPAAQFKNHAPGIKTWLAQSDVMLGRYRQWLKMAFDDWGHGQLIAPHCTQVLAVHRLYLAEGFAQDVDAGMDRLEADMTAWRTALAQAKTLSVKMMAAQAIDDDVAVASGLLTRSDLDLKQVPRLLKLTRPLDQVEQSLRWPVRSQFVVATSTLDGELRRDKADERPWYVSLVASMPLPKQRRFNAYADYYEAASKTSAEARPTSMPKLSTYVRTPATGWLDHLLNPIEHIVGVEPLPRWEDYSLRIQETDTRLRLASLQGWVRKGPSEDGVATRIARAGQHFYDPFTGLPMLIQSQRGVIYSVGRDGKDQDGDPKLDLVASIPSSVPNAKP